MSGAHHFGTPIALASGQNVPYALAVDATHVYWTNSSAGVNDSEVGAVMEVPLGGGAPTVLAAGQVVASTIAVDATHVYWASGNGGGALMKVPLAGGAPTLLAPSGASNLAVDAERVYWSDGTGAVMAVPRGGRVQRARLGPGQPVRARGGRHPRLLDLPARRHGDGSAHRRGRSA